MGRPIYLPITLLISHLGSIFTGAVGDTTPTDSRSRRNRASRRGGQLLTRAHGSWNRAAIDRHLRELDRLGDDLAVLDREIAESALDNSAVKRLLTITGVNLTVAASLMAAIGDIRRFDSPGKPVSYFGPNPRVASLVLARLIMGASAMSGAATRAQCLSRRLGGGQGAGTATCLLRSHPRLYRCDAAVTFSRVRSPTLSEQITTCCDGTVEPSASDISECRKNPSW